MCCSCNNVPPSTVPTSMVPPTSIPCRMWHNPYCLHLLHNRTPSLLPKLLTWHILLMKCRTHCKCNNSFSEIDPTSHPLWLSYTALSIIIDLVCQSYVRMAGNLWGRSQRRRPSCSSAQGLLNNMSIGHRTPSSPFQWVAPLPPYLVPRGHMTPTCMY